MIEFELKPNHNSRRENNIGEYKYDMVDIYGPLGDDHPDVWATIHVDMFRESEYYYDLRDGRSVVVELRRQ